MEYGKCARKAGNTILAALAVVVISVGPVAAQEGTFHALFSEGYGFLQKKVEGSVFLPAGNPVSEERPFQTLFADSYAVIRAAGQPPGGEVPGRPAMLWCRGRRRQRGRARRRPRRRGQRPRRPAMARAASAGAQPNDAQWRGRRGIE